MTNLSHLEPLGIPEKVKYLTNGLSELDAACQRNSQACFLRRSETKNRAEKGLIHAEMAKNRVSRGRVPYVYTDLTPRTNTAARCSTQMRIESWSRQVLDRRLAEVIRFVIESH